MVSLIVVIWSQGSFDIIPLDKVASIRVYRSYNRFNVHINTVSDTVRNDKSSVTFDFHNIDEILKLPAIVKHALSNNLDIVFDLKNEKIYEAKKGVILVRDTELQNNSPQNKNNKKD